MTSLDRISSGLKMGYEVCLFVCFFDVFVDLDRSSLKSSVQLVACD